MELHPNFVVVIFQLKTIRCMNINTVGEIQDGKCYWGQVWYPSLSRGRTGKDLNNNQVDLFTIFKNTLEGLTTPLVMSHATMHKQGLIIYTKDVASGKGSITIHNIWQGIN
jgi:hypothetical protein